MTEQPPPSAGFAAFQQLQLDNSVAPRVTMALDVLRLYRKKPEMMMQPTEAWQETGDTGLTVEEQTLIRTAAKIVSNYLKSEPS